MANALHEHAQHAQVVVLDARWSGPPAHPTSGSGTPPSGGTLQGVLMAHLSTPKSSAASSPHAVAAHNVSSTLAALERALRTNA